MMGLPISECCDLVAMRIIRSKTPIWLLLVLFFSVACVPPPAVRPPGFDSYEAVLVRVSSEIPATDTETEQLTTLLVDALNDAGIYRQVGRMPFASELKTLRVDVEIVHMNRTSDAKRIAFGKMAMSNEVRVQVKLTDQAAGTVLTSFPLEGTSPKRSGIQADWPWGNVNNALRQISRQLVRRLAAWSTPEN